MTSAPELEALNEYLRLREEMAELEAREDECRCDDFHTCTWCSDLSDKSHRSRGLMNLWGDNWAVRLNEFLEAK